MAFCRISEKATKVGDLNEQFIHARRPAGSSTFGDIRAVRFIFGRLMAGVCRGALLSSPSDHRILSTAVAEALAELDPKKQKTYAEIIGRKLVRLAANEKSKLTNTLIMAIAEMADRTEGRPKQRIEQDITQHVDPETRVKRIAELLAGGNQADSPVLTASPEVRTRKPS